MENDNVSRKISIHSLVKRETGTGLMLKLIALYFNPLPRKEGDVLSSIPSAIPIDFNPLPRKEGDIDFEEYIKCKHISIHSLVKRETLLSISSTQSIALFQSTPS